MPIGLRCECLIEGLVGFGKWIWRSSNNSVEILRRRSAGAPVIRLPPIERCSAHEGLWWPLTELFRRAQEVCHYGHGGLLKKVLNPKALKCMSSSPKELNRSSSRKRQGGAPPQCFRNAHRTLSFHSLVLFIACGWSISIVQNELVFSLIFTLSLWDQRDQIFHNPEFVPRFLVSPSPLHLGCSFNWGDPPKH